MWASHPRLNLISGSHSAEIMRNTCVPNNFISRGKGRYESADISKTGINVQTNFTYEFKAKEEELFL